MTTGQHNPDFQEDFARFQKLKEQGVFITPREYFENTAFG